jgi:hypothetical protein
MAAREQFCWLFGEKIPVRDGSPYQFQRSDISVFETLFRLIFPKLEFCQQELQLLSDSYHAVIHENPEPFAIAIYQRNSTSSLHNNLRRDLTRTIGVFRKAENSTVQQPDSVHDTVMECLARILVFADRQGIHYHQGFVEVLIPIFQIVFYGLSGISTLPGDPKLIEGICGHLFVKFMRDQPFAHFSVFPPADRIDQKLTVLTQKLQKYELGYILSRAEVQVSVFACRWIMLLFMQDLNFRDVLVILKDAFERMRLTCVTFHDCLVDYCLSAAVLASSKCRGKTSTQIIQILQRAGELAGVTGESIIKPQPVPVPRKRGRRSVS